MATNDHPSDDEEEKKKLTSHPSSASDDDWEKLSFHLSSSSDDEEKPPDDADWFFVKDKKPDPDQDQDQENNNDGEIYSFYGGEESESDADGLIFMREALGHYLPEIAAIENFSLEFVECDVFPHLPASVLLGLRRASRRWAQWISNPFFVHRHSLTSRPLSGFFFQDRVGTPDFATFETNSSLPDPSLSFLPELVAVMASNHGLVCCHGWTTLRYYICNPATAQWALLPAAANDHGPDPAVAIVMREPMTFNFDDDYFLVCAYEIFEGVYGFETFSSERWEWVSSNEVVAAEKIVTGSGVGALGAAYWRTTMERVVAFDPVVDEWRELVCPEGAAAGIRCWEIGELGSKLCVVSVGRYRSSVWIWENGRFWKKVGEIGVGDLRVDEECNVVPLRAQGEAAVWNWRTMTITARNMELQTERDLDCSEEPGYCADFVPYVSSLVHVKRYDNEQDRICYAIPVLFIFKFDFYIIA